MADYLIALLRVLADSLLALFARIPAAQFLLDWLPGSERPGVASVVAVSAAALLGAAAALLFLWILSRNPRRDSRARALAAVLPFGDPKPAQAPSQATEEHHAR